MAEKEQGALGGAASGAAAGAAVGGPWGAVIGGAIGLVGGLGSGKGAERSRKAAQAAALARQREVAKYGKYQQGLADRINTAMDNPAELAALSSAMGAAERDLGRQEQMIQALDPALKEAAAQAFNLLQGKDAASLAPLRADRAQKRQTLLNTLRAQLGPGAENSSAGQQALNRFDSESSNMLAQTQQSTLSSLFTMADRGTQYNLGQGTASLANMANAGYGRTAQGIGMQSDLMSGAWKARTGVAGSQFTGNMMQGQYQNQAGGQIIGAAGGLAGMFGGLGGGGSSSSTPGITPNSGGDIMSSGQMNNYDLGGNPWSK